MKIIKFKFRENILFCALLIRNGLSEFFEYTKSFCNFYINTLGYENYGKEIKNNLETLYDIKFRGFKGRNNELEFKKNLYDLKKTYYDVVQSKEQQIILLNQNHDMTLENCEKLIKEAESNYMNLKTEYDQVMEKMRLKEGEIDELKNKYKSQDNSINYYKDELNKMKDINYASEIEAKYNSLLEENVKLKQKGEEESSKLKEENDLLKKNIDMIDKKYKEKCK